MNGLGWRCVLCGSWFAEHAPSCVGCLDAGTIVRIGTRASAAIDFTAEVTTAAELARASWTPVVSSAYTHLRLGVGALLVVYGPAGGGKSSLATRLLDGLRAPVILQSVEEPPGPSLHARLARCGVKRNDFTIAGRASVDQLAALIRDRKAVALGIDSVQVAAFTPDDLRHLLLVLPTLQIIVAIAQVNKRGEIEGRERLLHEADIAIRVEDLRWTITKSRYQPNDIAGSVLAEEVQHEIA